MDIFHLLNVMNEACLDANETLVLNTIIFELNKKFWKPVAIKQDVAGRGMHRETFFSVRKRLVCRGLLVFRPGEWKTAPPVYALGPKFEKKKKDKTKEITVRTEDEIREMVKEIDRAYPDFSGFCALYSWDKAVRLFKAAHPELATQEWPVDSIGDPDNRRFAHRRFVWLHERKMEKATGAGPKQPTPPKPVSAWDGFYIFVDIWRLTYPKKARRDAVMTAVKDFVKGKEQWAPEQVKGLQETITAHTAAYVASFGGDFTYMVSPANYFTAEKWTEKISVKKDKTDVNCKAAGAHAIPNMPKMTTIKVN